MADNSSRLDAAGATETMASDDIGGVKYQRVKLATGADGIATDVREVPAAATPNLTSGVVPVGLQRVIAGSQFATDKAANAIIDGGDGSFHGSAQPVLFNETTFDRQRGNTTGTVFASAARTASIDSSVFTNYNARGVMVGLNITVASGTGGLQVTIWGLDPVASQIIFLHATPTAITATGTYGYELYPGATTAGSAGTNQVNLRVSGSLPRMWGVRVTHGNATSYTYSVSYSLIV